MHHRARSPARPPITPYATPWVVGATLLVLASASTPSRGFSQEEIGQAEAISTAEAIGRYNRTIEFSKGLGIEALVSDAAEELRRELENLAAPLIYLGDEVPANQHANAVAVFAGGGWNCSGTLIAMNLVITAGHCPNPITRVLFGASVSSGVPVNVIDRYPHPPASSPDYDRPVLLRLERTPPGITPARRATNGEIEKQIFAHVVGFGATNNAGAGSGFKRAANIRIVSYHCNSSQKGIPDAAQYHCEPDREIVAGQPGSADTCKGDSGGPLYIGLPGNAFAIAGITRRGVTAACGSGGVYMRINKYSIWLKQYIP
jgi:hypothetical protein